MMLWQHSGEEQISSRRWKAGWGQGVVCSAHDCYGSKMGAGAKRDEAAVIIVLSKTDKQPEEEMHSPVVYMVRSKIISTSLGKIRMWGGSTSNL